ncbi:MAG: DEAD/DEAH box helicase family protein [Magnetococcales bacterium]|nr:DEAD/DEAH box helicase family protein [Magnetococcales bacterium]
MSDPVPPLPDDLAIWESRLHEAICSFQPATRLANEALAQYPNDPEFLFLAALAALIEERPDRCLKYLKRLSKKYIPERKCELLRAIAQMQQGLWNLAIRTLEENKFTGPGNKAVDLPCQERILPWVNKWVRRIYEKHHLARLDDSRKFIAKKPSLKTNIKRTATRKPTKPPSEPHPPSPSKPPEATPPPNNDTSSQKETFALPFERFAPEIHIEPLTLDPRMVGKVTERQEPSPWFRLREEVARLELLQGFDELLCLPHLRDVTIYWYQVEAVRKVLRHFRGRVLLADEVGLGKTIEAGMVIKEYLLRGMVERILILTPASLVGQWHEEMATKFGIAFTSSYDPLLKENPDAFWDQPRVIASIATARRREQFDRLLTRPYDLVIIDEAHHLKDRTTRNWQLVDGLKKRFLLLLSATPVQNSLVELYNLLTLLKPGIFKTEREFRATYMTPRKPRIPANRLQLRELMRDVMIRNTRALVDVRLPPRQAVTLRVDGSEDEQACYAQLDLLVRDMHQKEGTTHRLTLHHLLAAAGSSPQAAIAAIERLVQRDNQLPQAWHALLKRYQTVASGAKERALLDLLRRNPDEKKMVFIHHRETMTRLATILQKAGIAATRFEGGMSGPDKDAAVVRFRDEAAVLLCTESGGEGRNMQFCNTMINFDLPWNPMAIEQRIGRIHRIGQTREVFIFNLASRGSVEDRLLRILDEKLNLFELVVGEVDAILGEIDEEQDFASLVFTSWVRATDAERDAAFLELEERMATARQSYNAIKQLDEELFGEEFESA